MLQLLKYVHAHIKVLLTVMRIRIMYLGKGI